MKPVFGDNEQILSNREDPVTFFDEGYMRCVMDVKEHVEKMLKSERDFQRIVFLGGGDGYNKSRLKVELLEEIMDRFGNVHIGG